MAFTTLIMDEGSCGKEIRVSAGGGGCGRVAKQEKKATGFHLRHPVIRPVIGMQVHKIVTVPVHNNLARALRDSAAIPLPLRLDRHTVVAPVRVELHTAHFLSRTESDNKGHALLLKHKEKFVASGRQWSLSRDEVRGRAFHVVCIDVAAAPSSQLHTSRVPWQDVGVTIAGSVLRFQCL